MNTPRIRALYANLFPATDAEMGSHDIPDWHLAVSLDLARLKRRMKELRTEPDCLEVVYETRGRLIPYDAPEVPAAARRELVTNDGASYLVRGASSPVDRVVVIRLRLTASGFSLAVDDKGLITDFIEMNP